ncbi:MAG: diguanylate cyclase [Succinivibrio sp.]|nr:diguanylate cyclase [Succinivibrio sp.]
MNDAVRLLLSLRIDCFCVLLLCCYLYNLRLRTSAEVVCVWRISAKTLLFTVVDIAYYAAGYAYLMGHHSLPWLLLALKLGHDLLLIYLPYSTIISIVNLMFPGKVSFGRGYWFYALPYWGAVLCILSSPLNQAVEYLDDEGLPEHGELYWFVLVVQLYYMLLTVFDPLLKLSNVQSTLSSLSHKEKMIVIGGALLAVVAGPLELWLDLPLASAGYTLGLFFIIVNFQLRRISTDPLTGLNNRNALRRYVEHVFKNTDALKGTCLLFLDLDKFRVNEFSCGRCRLELHRY